MRPDSYIVKLGLKTLSKDRRKSEKEGDWGGRGEAGREIKRKVHA